MCNDGDVTLDVVKADCHAMYFIVSLTKIMCNVQPTTYMKLADVLINILTLCCWRLKVNARRLLGFYKCNVLPWIIFSIKNRLFILRFLPHDSSHHSRQCLPIYRAIKSIIYLYYYYLIPIIRHDIKSFFFVNVLHG